VESANLTGAVVAVLIYALVIAVFAARLAGLPRVESVLGLCLIVLLVPLLYLLSAARESGRSALYLLQLVLMIVYLLAELLLDYIFKIDFRSVRWMTIAYVLLFFAGTGGMIGVASHAGRGWMYASIVMFLAMAALAFAQRAVTGK
jgi:hypothetical protein